MTIRRIAIMMIAVLCVLSAACTKHMVLSGDSIEIERYEAHMSNYHQYNSPAWLGTVDGEIYFFSNDTNTEYDGWLCNLSDGNVRKTAQLKQASILGISGNSIVFQRYKDSSYAKKEPGLYSIDTKSGELTLLADGVYTNPGFYTENGVLQLMSMNGDATIPSSVISIENGRLLDANTNMPCYYLNNTKYCIAKTSSGYNYAGGPHTIYWQQDGSDAWQPLDLSYADRLSIMPVNEGLLIHSYGGPTILYFIQNDGTVVDLFNTKYSYTNSTIAVHGSDVFLSYKHVNRSGKWELSEKHYDDEGTYRIHLPDFKAEQLNNSFYPGLFILNDTYIAACDEACNLIKMDFDGKNLGSLISIR